MRYVCCKVPYIILKIFIKPEDLPLSVIVLSSMLYENFSFFLVAIE